jgi:uncharacterized membrane protein
MRAPRSRERTAALGVRWRSGRRVGGAQAVHQRRFVAHRIAVPARLEALLAGTRAGSVVVDALGLARSLRSARGNGSAARGAVRQRALRFARQKA